MSMLLRGEKWHGTERDNVVERIRVCLTRIKTKIVHQQYQLPLTAQCVCGIGWHESEARIVK